MTEINIFLKNIPMGEKGGFPLILCTNQCRSTIFKNYVKSCNEIEKKASKTKCGNECFRRNFKGICFHK